MEVEHTPMSDKVKERILEDAEVHAASEHYQMQARISYYTGATAERTKAWNEAIDEVLGRLTNYTGAFEIREHYNSLRYDIEQLKHKQP